MLKTRPRVHGTAGPSPVHLTASHCPMSPMLSCGKCPSSISPCGVLPDPSPGLQRPRSRLGGLCGSRPCVAGNQAARCPKNGGKVLVIPNLGAGAGFPDSPCGEHATPRMGIAELIPVQIIQLYFLPTIPNRKPVYFHHQTFTIRQTHLF